MIASHSSARYRIPISCGRIRSIHLPKTINTDKVKAEFKNGLLRLTAEIAEEARGKKIKPEAA